MSDVEKLLKLARNQDKTGLQQLLLQGVRIDELKTISRLNMDELAVSYTFQMTAAGILAMNGELAAAEFLRKEAGACSSWTAQGAAIGGQETYAESLRAAGADVNLIAQGAAMGGNQVYAETLRAAGASIHCIAQGAAQGGHEAFAETLRADGAAINSLAQGAALGGHEAYAEKLRAAGADINHIAQCAAIGGHIAYAEKLRAAGADINKIARGALMGGHLAYAETLRKAGIDKFDILETALQMGQVAYVETLRKMDLIKINDIAKCASNEGCHAYTESLWEAGANIKMIAGGMNPEIPKNKITLDLLLIRTRTPAYRKKLLNALAKKYPEVDHLKNKTMLTEIEHFIDNMRKFDINFEQTSCLLDDYDCIAGLQGVDALLDDIKLLILSYLTTLDQEWFTELYGKVKIHREIDGLDEAHCKQIKTFRSSGPIKEAFQEKVYKAAALVPKKLYDHTVKYASESKTAQYQNTVKKFFSKPGFLHKRVSLLDTISASGVGGIWYPQSTGGVQASFIDKSRADEVVEILRQNPSLSVKSTAIPGKHIRYCVVVSINPESQNLHKSQYSSFGRG